MRAYNAVASAFRRRSEATLGPAVRNQEGYALRSGCRLLPVYHCGNRSTNMNRSEAEQTRDWTRVKRALDATGASS